MSEAAQDLNAAADRQAGVADGVDALAARLREHDAKLKAGIGALLARAAELGAKVVISFAEERGWLTK